MPLRSQRLFRLITYRDAEAPHGARDAEWYDDSVQRFLDRFGGTLQFAGRSVLDVGCGTGALCAEAARAGATEVVGTDLPPMDAVIQGAATAFADVADRIRFVETAGDLSELDGRQFDVVVSKDAMEHYDRPAEVVARMAEMVRPGGELAIGFGPLWRSPRGGHLGYMTPVPWAHLVFDESTILRERRRFRPDEHAERWSEVRGGLNQMTLSRFESIMAGVGFEPTYFATNMGGGKGPRVARAASRIPALRELFATSVYSVWRRPA